MDDNQTPNKTLPTHLPATPEQLYTYRNRETGKIEQIDLRTGLIHVPYTDLATNQFCNMTADLICNEIREGKTLAKVLDQFNITPAVFYGWLAIFPEFKLRYTEARKQRADFHFHRALDLAEGAVGAPKDVIPGLKLAVDTHKWAAEKSDPERFAKPKEEGNMVGSITINLQTGVLDKEPPKDIVVDQYGNFQGFGVAQETSTEEKVQTVELNKNRWGVYEGQEESTSTEGEESTGIVRGSSSDGHD